MMGTTCTLKCRDDARERLWTVKPNHPIAAGIPETFVLDCEEMYGEPFDIAEPQETIFMGWFNGRENVYDYSLGNPSVPAPAILNETIRELTLTMPECELHGYTSAVGDNETRKAIADNLNERFGTNFTMNNLYIPGSTGQKQ